MDVPLGYLRGTVTMFELFEGRTTIGRLQDNDFSISSRSVSGNHAYLEVRQRNDAVHILLRDLGSMNGTFVNERLVRNSTAELQHGDTIRFGYDKYTYRLETRYGGKDDSIELSVEEKKSPPPSSEAFRKFVAEKRRENHEFEVKDTLSYVGANGKKTVEVVGNGKEGFKKGGIMHKSDEGVDHNDMDNNDMDNNVGEDSSLLCESIRQSFDTVRERIKEVSGGNDVLNDIYKDNESLSDSLFSSLSFSPDIRDALVRLRVLGDDRLYDMFMNNKQEKMFNKNLKESNEECEMMSRKHQEEVDMSRKMCEGESELIRKQHEEEMAELSRSIEKRESVAAAKEKHAGDLQSELVRIKQKSQQILLELQELRSEDPHKALSSTQKTLVSAREYLGARNNEIVKLREQLSRIVAEDGSVNRSSKDIDVFLSEIVEKNTALNRKVKEIERRTASTEKRWSDVLGQNSLLKERVVQLETAIQQQARDMHRRNMLRDERLAELHRKLASYSSEGDGGRRAAASLLVEELDIVRQEAVDSGNAAESARGLLQKTLAEKQALQEHYRKQCALPEDAQKLRDELESMESGGGVGRVVELMETVDMLHDEAAKREKRIQLFRRQNDELQQMVKCVDERDVIASLKSDCEQKDREIVHLNERIRDLEAENEELADEVTREKREEEEINRTFVELGGSAVVTGSLPPPPVHHPRIGEDDLDDENSEDLGDDGNWVDLVPVE